jgi:hypothetical protein
MKNDMTTAQNLYLAFGSNECTTGLRHGKLSMRIHLMEIPINIACTILLYIHSYKNGNGENL